MPRQAPRVVARRGRRPLDGGNSIHGALRWPSRKAAMEGLPIRCAAALARSSASGRWASIALLAPSRGASLSLAASGAPSPSRLACSTTPINLRVHLPLRWYISNWCLTIAVV